MSVIVMLAVAWVSAGVGLANALEVSALVHAERDWIGAGAHTVIVEPGNAEGDAAIDVAACDRLAQIDGINAAFAVNPTVEAATAAHAPGTRATLTRVSPGVFAFFSLPAPAGGAVLATADTLGPLGLRDGDTTALAVTTYDGTATTATGTVAVSEVDSPALGDDLSGTWMLPDLHTGNAAQCYVTADAAHQGAVQAYLSEALAAPDGTPAVVRERLSDSGYGLNFATAYTGRPLAWAWAAAAVFLTSLWAIIAWTRRSRVAVYATFGAHRRARMVLQVTEWALLSLIAAAWGWGIAVTFALGLDADVRTTLVQVTGHVIATWSGATLGVLVVSLLPVGTLLDALKDRS
ncbi:hypothetical protein [Cellulomonas biazotea]|uniref:ABC3 transporter permease protein domain-containing protein n=1 Tax=Cellulomonas biazotea TaxID=1709 RepID=A0A402DQD0_9CELL|nr:hypothetical protein [Cellulomonas biazotea]GCE76339.1 hypothetical protein CBZ_13950 [Cellulomonas biazotea]